MIESFLWGLFAASSLLLGAWLAQHFNIKKRVLGLIMAFGVGVLISAVAFELIEEAFEAYTVPSEAWPVAAGLLVGAVVFFVGDTIIDRFGGHSHERTDDISAQNSGKAILFGTALDAIPESIVIGLTIVSGGVVSAAMVAAVFLSNLPEAIASTTGLKTSGWKHDKILGMWFAVVIISALGSLAGYALFDNAPPGTVAFMLAFAGGALLTMVADSMAPRAYEDSGKLAGLVTTIGFGLAFAISVIK